MVSKGLYVVPQYDPGEGLGGGIGQGFGEGLSQGLQMLLKAKMQNMQRESQDRYEAAQKSDILKRSGHSQPQIDYILSQTPEVQKAFFKEKVYPYLGEIVEQAGYEDVPTDQLDFLSPKARSRKAREEAYAERRGSATEEASHPFKQLGKYVESLRTDPAKSQAAREKLALEGVDALSLNEIATLSPRDVEGLSPEEKAKFERKAYKLEQAMKRAGIASITPFIGRGLESMVRKQEDIEETPRTGTISAVGRLAAELPFLGLGGVGAETLLFGGGEAISEGIKKMATGEDMDFAQIGIASSLPVAFRGIGRLLKAAASPFRKFIGASEQAAEDFAKAASAAKDAGIDIEKAVNGNAQELGKWKDLTRDFTKKEAKASRIARETPKKGRKEAIKEFEGKLKKFEKYKDSVEADQEKLASLREKYTRKTPAAIAKESTNRSLAQKAVPELEKEVTRLTKSRGELADEIASFKGTDSEKKRLSALLEMKDQRLKDAEEELFKQIYMRETGKIRPSLKDLDSQAKDAVEKLTKEAKEKPIEDLYKFNEERMEKAKSLRKKKGAPRSEKQDAFQRAQDVYQKAYERRLKKIDDDLILKKQILSPENKTALEKEKEALKKRIERLKSEKDIHAHELGLRELKKAKMSKERLSPQKVSKGAEDIRISKVRDKLIEGDTPEKILKDSPNLKEELSKEAKKWHDKISKAKTPQEKKRAAIKLIPSIRSLTRKWLGIEIGGSALRAIIEETTGAKIPLTPIQLIRHISHEASVQRANNMSPEQRMKYYKRLRNRGVSSQKIRRIQRDIQKKRRSA